MSRQSAAISHLGKRIRQLRQQRKKTLVQISDKAGVTKGLLSRIENSRTLPSLPVLIQIIAALQVSLQEFFEGLESDIETPYLLIRPADREPIHKEYGVEGYRYERIFTHQLPASVVECTVLRLAPGAKRSKVTTDAWECKYVLKGEVDYVLDEETLRLNEGDVLFYNGRTPHVPLNPTNDEAILLVHYFYD